MQNSAEFWARGISDKREDKRVNRRREASHLTNQQRLPKNPSTPREIIRKALVLSLTITIPFLRPCEKGNFSWEILRKRFYRINYFLDSPYKNYNKWKKKLFREMLGKLHRQDVNPSNYISKLACQLSVCYRSAT